MLYHATAPTIVYVCFLCSVLSRSVHKVKVRSKVHEEMLAPCFQPFRFLVLLIYLTEIKLCIKLFCFPIQHRFFFIIDSLLFRLYRVFGAVFLQVHVTSLLADVHGIFSLLGGRWEIRRLSATFSFPVDIKPPPCICCHYLPVVL